MSNLKKMSLDLKKMLKEPSHDVPLVTVQEILSKINGYKNRHVVLFKKSNCQIIRTIKIQLHLLISASARKYSTKLIVLFVRWRPTI
jgi:hypothetical protein